MNIKVELGNLDLKSKLDNVNDFHKEMKRRGYVFIRAWLDGSQDSISFGKIASIKGGNLLEEWIIGKSTVIVRLTIRHKKKVHEVDYDESDEIISKAYRVRI